MTYMQKGGRPPKPAGQETVGGLQQMIQQVGDDPELQEDIAEVGSMPGGMELLFTTAAEEMMKAQGLSKGEGTKEQKAKQIRLYNLGGSVDYNEGGLAAATNQGDDDILLHVSPEEYEAITAMWGEPDINSKTGIPEYGFLSKIWKKVKKTVKKIVKSQLFQMIAPIALNFFAPGLGVAVGGWLGASGAAAGIVGNAVVGGAIGAAGGGKEGALMGAIGGAAAGGAGTKVGKSIGLTGKSASVVGEALMTGVGAEATGGDFMQGAISGGIQAGITRPMVTSGLEKFKQIGEEGIKSAFTKAPGTPDPALGVKAPPPHTLEVRDISGNIVQGPPDVFAADKTNLMDMAEKYALPALMMGAAGSGGGGYEGAEGPPPLPEGWGDPLPQLSFNREQYTPGGDYYTYGQAGSPLQGEQQFFSENVIPSTQLAEGAAAGAVPPGPAVGGVAQAPVPINHPYAQQYLQQGWTRSPDGQMLLPPQQPPPFPALVAKGGLMRAHLQRGGRPALGRPGAQGRMSPQQ